MTAAAETVFLTSKPHADENKEHAEKISLPRLDVSGIHRHEVHVAARHELVDPGRDDRESKEEPADLELHRWRFGRNQFAYRREASITLVSQSGAKR